MGRNAAFLGALLGAGLFCAGGAWLDQSPQQQHLRERLQTRQVPSPLLDSGMLGSILQRSDLVGQVPNDGQLYTPTAEEDESKREALEQLVFRRKSRVGELLYDVRSGEESTFPDSSLPSSERNAGDWSVVSVAVDPERLASQLEDYLGSTEDRAEVSFYRAGELEHRLRVGLRLHGGYSRLPGRDHSYRLHLRSRYGEESLPSGLVFDGDLDPVRTLILRRVVNLRFSSSLGYEIFTALGVDSTRTEPALLYLNGERLGVVALTEHLSTKQLPSRIGHGEFLVFRRRGSSNKQGEIARDKLLMWVLDHEHDMSAELASQYVNLDQFSRYMLGMAFCHAEDWEQGAAILDLSDPESTWRWIPWDLDRSFRIEAGETAFDTILSSITEKRESIPAVLFRALVARDASYRASFAKLATECINHRLTTEFLRGRAAYYASLPRQLGEASKFDHYSLFFGEQRQALMTQLTERFQQGAVLQCRIEAGAGIELLRIDGYEHSLPYDGLYLAGQTLQVERISSTHAKAIGWSIDGAIHPAGPLQLVLTQDTVLTPVSH
ncbi:MAG: hypothetical protein ACI8QC_003766 [Planctomycetota bacterium]|jgi:hypothetical protein